MNYNDVLKKIDELRSKGMDDSHPELKQLKQKLWAHLEKRKKKNNTAIVPTVTAVKTVQFETKSNLSQFAETAKELKDKPVAKYFMLGVVIAAAFVIVKVINRD